MSNHIPAREVDWLVSSSCESGACVQVARQGDVILISGTDDPDGPVNEFTLDEWYQFLTAAKRGDFDNIA